MCKLYIRTILIATFLAFMLYGVWFLVVDLTRDNIYWPYVVYDSLIFFIGVITVTAVCLKSRVGLIISILLLLTLSGIGGYILVHSFIQHKRFFQIFSNTGGAALPFCIIGMVIYYWYVELRPADAAR